MTVVYGRDFPVTVAFRHPNHGKYEDRLEILFEDVSIRQDFAIVRPLRLIVGVKSD